MGGARSAYGGEERCIHGFGGETWGKENAWETRLRWGDNIKIDIQEVGCGGMGWVVLAQGRGRWRALLNMVMNVRVP
jgi:hypothetical protein